jgi:3-oxoacyl-[acyl-carrier-protein] synthase-1
VSTIHLNELGLVCALGSGRDAVARALFASDAPQGVASNTSVMPGRTLMLGAVHEALPALDALPRELHGRNNALLAAALQQIRPALDAAIAQHGPERVAVVLGTSTSGVGESEAAHRSQHAHGRWPDVFHYAQQEMGTPAAFVAQTTGCRGPAYTISTACSSSAKALASAARLLRSGVADAVICGGADSLCAFTIAGFTALGAVSAARCKPFSRRRDGINIGEGAALFLATRAPGPVRLMGWGESADAHHMSAPDPGGAGPEAAIRAALQRAALGADEIDYVNLHGTATLQNDAMEAAVMRRVFGEVAASSTKPLTGHALGAAGAIEAAICWLALAQNPSHTLPPHWWDGEADPAFKPLDLVAPGRRAATPLRHVLSQSFAFGGSNAALVLGAA